MESNSKVHNRKTKPHKTKIRAYGGSISNQTGKLPVELPGHLDIERVSNRETTSW